MQEKYRQIGENIAKIRAEIAKNATEQNVKLLCATKMVDAETINYACENFGITHIGENRAQELLDKYPCLQKQNLFIHFIGSLQKNKVRQIIDKVDMIHSLDSYDLALEINRRAEQCGKKMDVLIEINIAREPNKSGIMPEDVLSFAEEISSLHALRIRGVMTMGAMSSSSEQYTEQFLAARDIFLSLKEKNIKNAQVDELSMGMSNSYIEALRCSATIVRVGNAIFGTRNNIIGGK